MGKRRQSNDEEDPDSDSDVSLVNVDFDYFDLNPDVDYLATKRLIKQLFEQDSNLFNLSEFSELILSQNVGTTIKTDGEEADPVALMTVLNMHAHQNHSSIKALGEYLLQKSSSDASAHMALQELFSQSEKHVGFLFCERLINMPVQTIPPMYRILQTELPAAIASGKSYTFSHLIILSRTYHLSAEELSLLGNAKSRQTSKRSKKPKNTAEAAEPENGVYAFHPEDDTIMQAASHTVDYRFTNAPKEPRNSESFGLDTRGRMMLVPMENLADMVERLNEIYV